MKRYIVLIIFFWLILSFYFITIFAVSAVHAGDWTKQDIALEGLWQVTNVIDTATTLNLVRRYDEGFYERHPLWADAHPSRNRVITGFATNALLHVALVNILPDEIPLWNTSWSIKPKRIFQSITIGVSTGCVENNFAIGLKGTF
jgi:hypothetical protein